MTEEPKKKIHRRSDKTPNKTPMREQKPKDRIKNYLEVPFGYSEEEALLEAERCLHCRRRSEGRGQDYRRIQRGRRPRRNRTAPRHEKNLICCSFTSIQQI